IGEADFQWLCACNCEGTEQLQLHDKCHTGDKGVKRTIGMAALILLVTLSLAACGKKKSSEASSQVSGTAQGTDVSADTNVTLPEGGETVAYVLAARMVSDYLGSEAFVAETGTGAGTFWTTVDYLVSAYGTQNEKISTSEDGLSYEVKLEQLRYYAAALYADLGKAKDLPELSEMMTGVTLKSKKVYLFSIADTSQYRVTIHSLAETDDGYGIRASLLDSTSGEAVAQYAVSVKKSAYTGKKSPFHYAVAGLSRMTKIPLVEVLVGPKDDPDQAGQSTTEGQDPTQGAVTDQTVPAEGAQGTTDGTQGTQIPAGQDSAGSTSDGGSSSSDSGAPAGSSSSAAGDQASSSSAGTGSSSSSDSGSSSADQGASQPADSGGGAGGGISNGTALEQARDYFGTTDEASGKTYVYSYEGTTAFNGTDYYNFSVTDGEAYVTNILVSYDGSRILKGTKNADGSWSLQ
ncbi:MAG TPA: hypothetical protein DF613_00045, partial [Lachnospiraceae bacterium]|nr:hypothetical protein [Lachnospiraceae bacterium]